MSTPDATPLPLSVELARAIRSETEGLCWRCSIEELEELIDARVRPLVDALRAVSEFDDEDWLPEALGAQVKAALKSAGAGAE